MAQRNPFSAFFISSTARHRESKYEVHIRKDSPKSVLNEITPNSQGRLPIVHIYGGANPEIIKRIPDCIHVVVLREGVDKTITTVLPPTIKIAEIYHGVRPCAIASIYVDHLILAGVSEELMQNITEKLNRIKLRCDIRPNVMASIPEHIKYLDIVGPISADALTRIPPSVKGVFFTKTGFAAFDFVDDHGVLQNTGRLLLKSLPAHLAVGVSGRANVEFLRLLPLQSRILMVENNNDTEFAAAIPYFISILQIDFNTSFQFIDAVPFHTEVVCSKYAKQDQKEYVARRNERRQDYLSPQAKMEQLFYIGLEQMYPQEQEPRDAFSLKKSR